MEVIRRHVWISGQVQGVFFRATCADEATGAGLSGWVRNLPDGRVEAVFEGPADAVDSLLAWCRLGPRMARVDRVEVRAEALEGLVGFRSRR